MKKLELRAYQKKAVEECIRLLKLGKKVCLVGCPGSGKTEMAIYIIKRLIEDGIVKRTLILPHSTSVLKSNFSDRIDRYKEELPIDDITIELPQSKHKLTGKFDMVVVDEAHENYLAGVVQSIVKNIGIQLLLTGTPSKLILKGGFEFVSIAMENVPSEHFAKVGIELVVSKYKWNETSYNNDLSLRASAPILMKDTKDAVEKVVECLLNRLKQKSLSSDEFNNGGFIPSIKKIYDKVFTKIGKSIFVCHRQTQANWVNDKLIELGYNSVVSHSKSDSDSELFDKFKEGEYEMLVVVNRGRLGYSDDNLMNIVDMSGTRNPDIIYQMFARCVRGTQDQQKMFIKLTPEGPAMMDLTNVSVCMALSLMFEEVITTFNGKNFKGMFIPILKETKSKVGNSRKGVKKNIERVTFPEYTNDVLVQLKDIKHTIGEECQIYKQGNIGEIISGITGCQNNKPVGYWTLELCIEDAKKYNSGREWSMSEDSASRVAAYKNGWLSECTKHMTGICNPNGFWTKERCIEDAKKYKTNTEWRKNSTSSHSAASTNKWFDECRKHMTLHQMPSGFWTKEKCIEDAKKYKTITDWVKNSSSQAYQSSRNGGWFDECIEHMARKQRTPWTKEECIREAKKYKTNSEWMKLSKTTYNKASKSGWLPECREHMTPIRIGKNGFNERK